MKIRLKARCCLACWFLAGPTLLLAEAAELEDWLRALGDDAFKTREAAESGLRTWAAQQPDMAQEFFLKQLEQSPDPEVRMRCRALLKNVVMLDFRKQGEGFVGIQMFIHRLDGAEPKFGVRVTEVTPDMPAMKAGVQAGDVLLELDGEGWSDENALLRFSEAIRKHRPGERVKLKVRRGAQDLDIEVELARRPEALDRMNGLLYFGEPKVDLGRLQDEVEEKYFKEWLSRRSEGSSPAPESQPAP